MTDAVDRLNPYARFLGDGDPHSIIETTPSNLSRLVRDVSSGTMTRSPAPGKWSIGEILAHIADTEVVFAFRLRQTVSEPHHVIQPYDQDSWAKPYRGLDAQLALATFAALRAWNVAFIRAVIAGSAAKLVTHPERGTMTFQNIVETMAGHDVNHTRQIEAIMNAPAPS